MRARQIAAPFFAFACMGTTLGQDEGGPIAPEDPAILERVEVTARRRSESALEVPMSIAVLHGGDLEERGATGFTDYANLMPGLSFSSGIGIGGEKHVLRGISSGAAFDESMPFTQLLFGDTPLAGYRNNQGLSFGVDPRLLDIERIEVLRGPQGTLFGASSMGGTVRIVPNEPALDRFEGSVSTSVSAVDHGGWGYSLDGVVNLPFADGAGAVRIVGFQSEVPGWIDNVSRSDDDVNGSTIGGGRVALRLEQGSLRGDFMLVFQDRSADGHSIDEIDDPRYQQTRALAEDEHDRWALWNATITYTGAGHQLISSTSFFDRLNGWTFDVSELAEVAIGAPNQTTQVNADENAEFTQELRLQSAGDGPIAWLGGAFFQHRTYGLDTVFPSPGYDAITGGLGAAMGMPDTVGRASSTTTHEERAVFLDLTARTPSGFELGMGVRWFEHEESFEEFSQGMPPTPYGDPTHVVLGYTESGITPRLSFAWHPDRTRTYYASVATGYSPGASNSQSGESADCAQDLADAGYLEVPDGFDSQQTVNFELGAKRVWPRSSAYFNAAVFHIDWTQIPEQVGLGCGAFFMVNGDETATSDGMELETGFDPTDDLSARFTASYQDARLADTGKRVTGVPWFTVALATTWYFTPGSYLRADLVHVDEAVENAATGSARFPGYQRVDLALVRTVGAWQAFARIANLFDRYAVTGVVRFPPPYFLGEWDTTLPPRTISFGVRRAF